MNLDKASNKKFFTTEKISDEAIIELESLFNSLIVEKVKKFFSDKTVSYEQFEEVNQNVQNIANSTSKLQEHDIENLKKELQNEISKSFKLHDQNIKESLNVLQESIYSSGKTRKESSDA